METLYIVATPIGNLDDMTVRAQKILATVDIICAEDTRVSRKLLSHFAIHKPLTAYHDFNKEKVTPQILEALRHNRSCAIITDAGTPGIADPAFYIIRRAIAEKIPVVPIPGPSACITALVASGLPTDRFIFENFLPSSSTKRKKLFTALAGEKRTVIFYESPHRIIKVLQEMDEILGPVALVIGRELTKVHEEFLRGTPQSLAVHFKEKKPRGEMVVLFHTAPKQQKYITETAAND